MAMSLTQDIITYNVKRGNPVFACSSDAEGAFDAISFGVQFNKAAVVLSDGSWRVLYSWYNDLYVSVRWNCSPGIPINVKKGTRQGGLSSLILFNILHQNMVHDLTVIVGGILL